MGIRCLGVHGPCSAYDHDQCGQHLGCAWSNNACAGVASSCQEHDASQDDCNAAGCTPYFQQCTTPSAWYHTCADDDSASTCTGDTYCQWTSACTGDPHVCEDMPQAECVSDGYCTWVSGTCVNPQAGCTTWTTYQECAVRGNCVWEAGFVCSPPAGCATHTYPNCGAGCVGLCSP